MMHEIFTMSENTNVKERLRLLLIIDILNFWNTIYYLVLEFNKCANILHVQCQVVWCEYIGINWSSSTLSMVSTYYACLIL